VALIVAGTLVFYLVESRRLLFGMTLPEKYGAALFQSITLRTAGFSTVSIGALHPGTLVALLPFMFIGAAAGGTAGGIKIGTAATISAEFRRFFTRRRDADLFNRRLPDGLVIQAFVLVVVGVAVVFVATVVLVFTEAHPLERLVFEVVSALGTVGLSAHVTPELSNVGRVTIIFLMLVGRLGPLTLLAAFRRIGRAPNVRLPRGELPIG
jgi:trk system potassium uptake protein TrkH